MPAKEILSWTVLVLDLQQDSEIYSIKVISQLLMLSLYATCWFGEIKEEEAVIMLSLV